MVNFVHLKHAIKLIKTIKKEHAILKMLLLHKI